MGHIFSSEGVKPDPKRIEAVQKFPRPKNPRNIKQFLGLAGYYRKFIEDFGTRGKPLTNLFKKGTAFKWRLAEEESYKDLRQALCESPILQYPDYEKPFTITTDAFGNFSELYSEETDQEQPKPKEQQTGPVIYVSPPQSDSEDSASKDEDKLQPESSSALNSSKITRELQKSFSRFNESIQAHRNLRASEEEDSEYIIPTREVTAVSEGEEDEEVLNTIEELEPESETEFAERVDSLIKWAEHKLKN